MVCSTGVAGAITGGGSNPSQMPTTTTEYNWWGRSATVRDTANGSTRTTTVQYDAAGRPTTTTVTGGIGQAVPASTTEYDPATGHPVKLTSPTGGTISKAYDKLGRQISYTDADGGVTTTEYDLLDRPAKTSDNSPSTVTYTYDHSVEPRGLATKATDSVAGVFQATYDADGSVTSQKLPGGYTLQQTEDTTGAVVRRTYTRDSDGVSVMTDTVTRSVLGQAITHAGWSNQSYAYDKVSRLTTVDDTTSTVCTKRTYAFDNRNNRKSLTTAAGAPGLDCPTTGGIADNHTYDSADRIVDTGYTYDAFGRATATPGNGTIAYYANDLAYQQTASGKRPDLAARRQPALPLLEDRDRQRLHLDPDRVQDQPLRQRRRQPPLDHRGHRHGRADAQRERPRRQLGGHYRQDRRNSPPAHQHPRRRQPPAPSGHQRRTDRPGRRRVRKLQGRPDTSPIQLARKPGRLQRRPRWSAGHGSPGVQPRNGALPLSRPRGGGKRQRLRLPH
ncbi:putative YD repeat-containing protein [Streptomyces viridochromogenes Tue57]|uniref:Putative YD repeat-containing protein n=1 Tax=Streptomyces viridochromogenes Tue57 TaxID=1160705 RepID=L8PU69_STRVR|nr:putative YD repeat-containing protein [Streptomyces viridochromogenes Tue57]